MSEYRNKTRSTLSGLLTGGDEVREPTAAEWHTRIVKGFPLAALDSIKQRASLNDKEISGLVGISEATLRRARAAHAQLDAEASDRLYRFSKVLAVAIDLMQDTENAMTWLRRPQPGLAGRIPLQLLNTQAGADEVETLLRRIEYGVYT